jgi:hypothetical protein
MGRMPSTIAPPFVSADLLAGIEQACATQKDLPVVFHALFDGLQHLMAQLLKMLLGSSLLGLPQAMPGRIAGPGAATSGCGSAIGAAAAVCSCCLTFYHR